MIQFIENINIDKTKWDNCINNSTYPLIYAQSWFLDIVSPNWNALVEDNYSAVFPLTQKKKIGISYLCQPIFSQQLGIFSQSNISEKTINDFLAQIPSKYKLVEINLNISNNVNIHKPFSYNNNKTTHLDLSKSYDDLHKEYADNHKRNLRKTQKFNLQVVSDYSAKEVINLFKTTKAKKIDTLNNNDYSLFEHLIDICIAKKVAEVYGVFLPNDPKLLAGMIILKMFNQCIFIFSAISDKGKEMSAMHFLIDNFIKDNSNSNLIFDFEGSNNPNLLRFYTGFGADIKHYPSIKRNNLPAFIKLIKSIV